MVISYAFLSRQARMASETCNFESFFIIIMRDWSLVLSLIFKRSLVGAQFHCSRPPRIGRAARFPRVPRPSSRSCEETCVTRSTRSEPQGWSRGSGHGQARFSVEGLRFHEAQTELDVVGQCRPQHFGFDFDQSAHVELPQPQFALDPGVTELHHRTTFAVERFGLGGAHLLAKGFDRGAGLGAQQVAAVVARATGSFQRTALAVAAASSVAMVASPAPGLPSFRPQQLALRTNIAVWLRIVDEGRRAPGMFLGSRFFS